MICTVGHGARSVVGLVSILQKAHIRTYLRPRAVEHADAGLTLTTR